MLIEVHRTKGVVMGLVHADIELINTDDLALARKSVIGEDEVKRFSLRILVDTGSWQLAINENIQEVLQLPVVDTETAYMADGSPIEFDVVGPVELRFENRKTACYAWVLPGDTEPLLGVIPLEGMDVLIDTKRQELIVNPAHPDKAAFRL